MREKRNIGYILLPLMLCSGIIGGIFIGRFIEQRRVSPSQEKVQRILDLIESQYVDEIDVDSLLETSIPDLLMSLDPHSAYIPASELTQTNDELEGSFGGVGVSFQIINDTVNVIEVVAGGPAEKVGLLPGDRIIEADGKQLSGAKVTNEDVFSALRGKEGTKVKIRVKRSNSKTLLDYEVIRGEIPSNSVDASYMIADNTGYIKVSKFARTTYSEFLNALSSLKEKGASRYIVDLRNNSGGYMDQAIFMANEFLPGGKMIVYTKGRTPENETIAISDGTGSFQDADLTVLTNEFSASASEIFAGAMQDNDRGVVIGRRSFGKGLVQNQTELPDSSAIRLTVARYYTPSGR
ncbi:MAG: S41 family peptidase, partial [Muribaculaceae bacterium]|nr:S41 family peptidase [Muribaculaceae bacterium]